MNGSARRSAYAWALSRSPSGSRLPTGWTGTATRSFSPKPARGAPTSLFRPLLLTRSPRRGIGDAMARLPAARRFVRRFVAGERAEDALQVIARLNAQGLLCAVTSLGENVAPPADAAHAARAYVELLEEIERRSLSAVPSLKLTHLGLDLGEAVCRANLEAGLARGRASSALVWIDMESSADTERTLN